MSSSPAPDSPKDLSSFPSSSGASAGKEGISGRKNGAAGERKDAESGAQRFRRNRKNQLLVIGVGSILLIVGVLFAVLFNVMSSDGKKAASSEDTCTGEVKPAVPSKTTVNVFNVTPRIGMANDVADAFKGRGFSVGVVGNYNGPLQMPGRTSVRVVVKANSETLDQALAIQRQLPDSVFQLDNSRRSKTVDIFLIDEVKGLQADVDDSLGGLICH